MMTNQRHYLEGLRSESSGRVVMVHTFLNYKINCNTYASKVVALLFLTTSTFFYNSVAWSQVSVNCGSTTISSAISSALTTAKVGQQLVFNITGTCTDNINIPEGVRVVLNGAATTGTYGAKIVTSNLAIPTVYVGGGELIMNRIDITGSGTAASSVLVDNNGTLTLNRSRVTSITNSISVTATASSTAKIQNSTITNAVNAAIIVIDGAFVQVYSDNGRSTNISYTGATGGEVIGCYRGTLNVSTSGPNAFVNIGPSEAQGISSRGCSMVIGNGSIVKNSVRIRNTKDVAIRGKSGDSISIVNSWIYQNTGKTFDVSTGTIEIDNSTIESNTDGIQARRGGVVYFNTIYGISSVTGTNPYSCYQDGKVYADSGSEPTGGAASPGGCLTVGGDAFN